MINYKCLKIFHFYIVKINSLLFLSSHYFKRNLDTRLDILYNT